MHTLTVEVKGTTYHIHHNGDWSGEVAISWRVGGTAHEIELPGELFRSISRQRVLDEVRVGLEKALDKLLL